MTQPPSEPDTYEFRERVCIKHFDGGIPWDVAVEQTRVEMAAREREEA